MSTKRFGLRRLAETLRHPASMFSRKQNGCDTCGFPGKDDRGIVSKRNLETWIKAAKHCHFCGLVVTILDDLKAKHGIDPSAGGRSQVYLNGAYSTNEGGRFYLKRDYNYLEVNEESSTNVVFYNHIDTDSPWNGLPYDQDVSSTADSKSCLDLVKYWLHSCQNSHSSCDPESSKPLPTRVLDVNYPNPKLVITSNLPRPVEKYVALSHCWGSSQPLRTLNGNIEQHRNGIDLNILPQTFQDAIRLTRNLKFQYIWIDSLCIIQDDALDWEREAAKMAEVYGHAYLVLGASSASDGTEGFFSTRTLHWRGEVTVPSPAGGKDVCRIHYRPLLEHPMPNAVNPGSQGPLEKRGWTFQERVLAKRFVSFGRYELTWGCNSLWDCECDWVHARRGKRDEYFDLMLKNSISLYPKIDQMSEEGIYHNWRFAVASPYSARNLTYSHDKLVALSAITRTFHDRLDDVFLAGLWKKQLPRDMSWYCYHELEELESQHTFVPSWSWVSVKGGVFWSMAIEGFRFEKTCRVIEAECTPASEINPFGSVTAGHVLLEGKLSPAHVQYHPKGSIYRREKGHHYSLAAWPTSSFYADVFLGLAEVEVHGVVEKTATRLAHSSENEEHEDVDYPVWCFVLGTYRSGQTSNAAVIVLGRSVSEPTKFTRLGFVELELGYGSSDDFFTEWSDETVHIL
ncbi:het domain-containing protein [Colletotrichum incanum]|uniref:Het domain-containing protein n=1 Tax=Colletotrichum incanum TaxID=1573173 RepID=A0A161X0B2_COLIC|nr:het domain-containing protein [Colletotrichum incanum]